jgi:hypothetical protein
LSNDYYTYAYLREDGTPYYIGKGRNKRHLQNCGRGCQIPKDRSRILFLKQNLTEGEAFKHERYMIFLYGRIDLGTGILRNKSDGGEGPSNRILTDQTRKRMSDAAKKRFQNPKEREKYAARRRGKPGPPMHDNTREALIAANTGRPCSEETKRKISEANRGKPITPEAKEKMSLAKKGKAWSPARRAAQEQRKKKQL